jgi:hypothetical protein
MNHGQEFGDSTTSVPPPPIVKPVLPVTFDTESSNSLRGAERKRIWILAVICFVVAIAAIAFFSRLIIRGYRQSSELVGNLHKQMSQQDWKGIYSAAAPQYRDATSETDNDILFSGIDKKLGTPTSTKQESVLVNSNGNGTTIQATFETKFSRDATATETISWRFWNGQYRLESYNISSMALLK